MVELSKMDESAGETERGLGGYSTSFYPLVSAITGVGTLEHGIRALYLLEAVFALGRTRYNSAITQPSPFCRIWRLQAVLLLERPFHGARPYGTCTHGQF